MDIREFAQQLKVQLQIIYLGDARDPHWRASFGETTRFLDPMSAGLTAMEGRARTPERAIQQFCRNISGQMILLNYAAWINPSESVEAVFQRMEKIEYISNTET